MILLYSALLGLSAGLRVMTPAAVLSWAAFLGWLDFTGKPFAFIGHPITLAVLTLFALGEYVTDQLPQTPSRTVPVQFGARLLFGCVLGAVLALPAGMWVGGAIAGVIGAAIGTYGGAAVRRALTVRFGADRPAAVIEDIAAVLIALAAVGLA